MRRLPQFKLKRKSWLSLWLVGLLFAPLLLPHSGFGADYKSVKEVYLDLDLKEVTIEDAFDAIENRTHFTFSYDRKVIDQRIRLDLVGEGRTVADYLLELSKTGQLKFKQINHLINVNKLESRRESKVLEIVTADIEITGTVTDIDNGDPIPGVSIIVQGTGTGTVTDFNGQYKITAPEDGVLIYSFVGYETVTEAVNGRSVINIEMPLDLAQLEEVVVVGYGTQEKGVVTGSVSEISMDKLESVPLTSVEQAMQGRVAGVQVTQVGGGQPGGGMQVNIRGIGTVNGENPLYVIDGIPQTQGGQTLNSYSLLNSLNPNDIESITILKDASAAAIYGNRASGGVVLITTKRGSAGPTRVNLNVYGGTQLPGPTYDVLNTNQYLDYLDKLHSQPDADLPPAFQPGGIKDGTDIDTDWQDELYNSAPIQSYDLDISGGTENATFGVGLGYFDQQGTMLGTKFERYSLRLNSDFKIGNRIKIGETVTLSKTFRNFYGGLGGRRPQEHAIKQAPTVPILDDTYKGGYGWPGADEGQDARNPIADAPGNLFTRDEDRWRFFGSIFGEWEIVDGLTYRINLGYTFQYTDELNYNPEFEEVRRRIANSEQRYNRSDYTSVLAEHYITYRKSLGLNNFSILGGFSAQEDNFSNAGGSGQDLPDGITGLNNATNNIQAFSGVGANSLRSFFGRLTYDYDNKYLLTANIRRDESSKIFKGNNPVGVFPSISAGWRLTEEAFLQGNDYLSNLKIKAGWGELGNINPLSNFATDVNLSANYFYVFGNDAIQGIGPSAAANPDLQWETTTQLDIGVESGWFEDRLLLNFNYYKRNTTDLILQAPPIQSEGLESTAFINAGEIENSGIELELTYRKYTGDFTFDISGNITTINNEVLGLATESSILFSGSVTDDVSGVSRTQVGEPIGTFYGHISDGIFSDWDDVYNWPLINQSRDADGNYVTTDRDATTATSNTAPGDVRWVDVNEDGVVDNNDQVELGSPIPDLLMGFTFSGAYRNFDFSVFVQGAYGHQIYNAAKRWLVDFRQNFNQGVEALNAEPYSANYAAAEPRIVRADPNRNVLRSSDRYVFDGDYTRIKNLTIGYTFNPSVTEAISAQRLRVYFTAQNLATFSDYFGLEPEVGSVSTGTALDLGIDRLVYPQPRTFILGVQLGF